MVSTVRPVRVLSYNTLHEMCTIEGLFRFSVYFLFLLRTVRNVVHQTYTRVEEIQHRITRPAAVSTRARMEITFCPC